MSRRIFGWRAVCGRTRNPLTFAHGDRNVSTQPRCRSAERRGRGYEPPRPTEDGRMTVLFVGASHATAPLPLVEHLSFSTDDAVATLARVTTGDLGPTLPVRELVLLSTCHRVELYAVSADDATRPSAALDAMACVLASRNNGAEAFDAHVRRLVGSEATRHLFRVAAGLESMV